MPKNCVVVGCTNNDHKQDGVRDVKRSFFEFPKRHLNPERRDKWLTALHRENPDGSSYSPPKSRTICSDHFVTGRPNKDPLHPDYVPSIFPHKGQSNVRARKNLDRYLRHEESQAKRQCVRNECSSDAESRETWVIPDSAGNLNEATYSVESQDAFDVTAPVEPSVHEQSSTVADMLSQEVENLRQERDTALKNLKLMEQKNRCIRLSVCAIEGDDCRAQFFTGLTWDVFSRTYEFLEPFAGKKTKDSMPFIDQFFVTLVKLRLNLPFDLISYQTGYHTSTIRDYFWRWIDLMYQRLRFLVRWPDRESIKETLPPHFKAKFPNLTCIIDCFEIFVDQPANLKARAQVYSNYKKHTTIKLLIACTPLGAICFLSLAWGGRVSDVELVRRSGFLSSSRHYHSDQILADRGFTLQDDFATMTGSQLIIPAFTKGKLQLGGHEVEASRKMSSVRIHVERVIGLLKNRYTILQGTIPIQLLKSQTDEASDETTISSIDKIVTVCAALINLGEGIVVK